MSDKTSECTQKWESECNTLSTYRKKNRKRIDELTFHSYNRSTCFTRPLQKGQSFRSSRALRKHVEQATWPQGIITDRAMEPSSDMQILHGAMMGLLKGTNWIIFRIKTVCNGNSPRHECAHPSFLFEKSKLEMSRVRDSIGRRDVRNIDRRGGSWGDALFGEAALAVEGSDALFRSVSARTEIGGGN